MDEQNHLRVAVMTELRKFNGLRDNWQEVWSNDPDAHVFSSWHWLRGWLETTGDRWFVLAAQVVGMPGYVGFLVLGLRAFRRTHVPVIRELYMGGNPFADHTGFVCLPAFHREALAAFARTMQDRLRWDRCDLDDVLDRRLDEFLSFFSPAKYRTGLKAGHVCPYATLPGSWPEYMRKVFKPNARREFERRTRIIEGHKALRTSEPSEDSLDAHIDALLTLWQQRWGQKPQNVLATKRQILLRCFEGNCLSLRVLWDRETPVAAVAGIVDAGRRVFSAYNIAFDAAYGKLSPGTVMLGQSIRHAIENGLRVYDLTRGDENYKRIWCDSEQMNRQALISRRSFRTALGHWLLRLPSPSHALRGCARRVLSLWRGRSQADVALSAGTSERVDRGHQSHGVLSVPRTDSQPQDERSESSSFSKG